MKKITLEDKTVIEISDESYKALQKGVQKKRVWRAEVKEDFSFVQIDGGIGNTYEAKTTADDYRHLTGNYFKTKEEAVTYKAKQEAIGRVTHAIIEANDGWEESLNDNGICIYMTNIKRFRYDVCCGVERHTLLPIRKSKLAEQIIKDHKEDLLVIFGVK